MIHLNELVGWLLGQTALYTIEKSAIAGKGVFAAIDLKKGQEVGLAFKKVASTGFPDRDYVRTELGAMVNHAMLPNMDIAKKGSEYHFVAKKDIKRNTELTVDYKQFDFEGKRDFAK
jgi:hypothetical protein